MSPRNPTQTLNSSLVAVIGVALFLIVLSGCGGGAAKDAPDLVEAYGKVTIDGSPAANVRVMFVTSEGSPAGVTDSSGNYTIEYNDEVNGAFPGSTTVVLKQMSASEFDDDPCADDEDCCADFDQQENRANAGKEWEKKVDVSADGAPFDFDLKSADAK